MPTVSSSFDFWLESGRPAALSRICVTNRITCVAWRGIEMDAFDRHGLQEVSLSSEDRHTAVDSLVSSPFAGVKPLLVGVKLASVLLGVGEQSLRNALSRNVLPFGTLKFMGRRMMKMNDLESFVAMLPTTKSAESMVTEAPQSEPVSGKRKRGRPRSQSQQQPVALKSRSKNGFRGLSGE